MTTKPPEFEICVGDGKSLKTADEAIGHIEDALSQRLAWVGREGGAGKALVHLFGRFAELSFNRLNGVPEKHFLAFLNEAGVDRLPARAASLDVAFSPAPDFPFIRVPAGTQVATVKTETQPEVLFETEKDLVAIPNALNRCVAFDNLQYSDCAERATGKETAAFAVFRGELERERILYLGDSEVFTFADDSERAGGTIELRFAFVGAIGREPDWHVQWEYYDEEAAKQEELASWHPVDPTEDSTADLTVSGAVKFSAPPLIGEHNIPGTEWTKRWLRARLTDITDVRALPVIDKVSALKTVAEISPVGLAPDLCFYHVTTSGVYIPLDTNAEFYPLGSRPGRHDTFYIAADEALSKPGAVVTLNFDIAPFGLPAGTAPENWFDDVELIWSYYDGKQWRELGRSNYQGTTPSLSGFDDKTFALTAESEEDQPQRTVTFTVPDGSTVPQGSVLVFGPPRPTVINEQEHYWLRVRLNAGFYGTEGRWVDASGTTPAHWQAETLYPPLVRSLTIGYVGTAIPGEPRPLQTTLGYVDRAYTDYTGASASEGQSFAPLSASEEGPALYLGFENAFPAGEWVQLLMDVEPTTEDSESSQSISWEYWNGTWVALRVSDGSFGLTQRGYVGFFGPLDQQDHVEFGEQAHWLRLRPYRPPKADAGRDPLVVFTTNDHGILTLDGSRSKAYAGHAVVKYTWRERPTADAGNNAEITTRLEEGTFELDATGSKAPSGTSIKNYHWDRKLSTRRLLPIADVKADIYVRTDEEAATITLDASTSLAAERRPITNYRWDVATPEVEDVSEETVDTPWLRRIYLNSVAAINAETIQDETLGSSDDTPNQTLTLLRSPVLPGAQIDVREPDRPPEEELDRLRKELREQEPEAEPLLSDVQTAPGEGVWVRWHQVKDFLESDAAARHFTLDLINGSLRFGDGVRGKIPPRGLDNIKASHYRTHSGDQGNAQPGTVTVLRNPSGDLTNIESVTNHEAAAGGSAPETVEQVKERGPQTLKHRDRAVTLEDFASLARESSGEIADARCLPTRNRRGLPEPGWVTVVITPKSTAAKPTPTPALIRLASAYLKDRALVNLKHIDQIYVKGPEYVEATITASVVPVEPEKADEIEIDVLRRLETFLHPLNGGPQSRGWALGRDVYLSEIYAEIETVRGVDYALGVRLQASLQQFYLRLGEGQGFAFEIPVESQISTFDESIKLVLAETVHETGENNGVQQPRRIGIYGLKVGDVVKIVAGNNETLVDKLKIASFSDDLVLFDAPFHPRPDWDQRDGLMSDDDRVRLLLVGAGELLDAENLVMGIKVRGFQDGDEISIAPGGQRDSRLEFIPVDKVEVCSDRVFVPEGHLVYSGHHDVKMRLG